MLTVISAFQAKRAGRLFVHTATLSMSFEPLARRCYRGSLAVFKTPLNITLFVVIVFIQLALNAYGYFKKNNGQEAKDKNTNRSSCTQFDSERFEADVSVNKEDREDPLDEGSSRNIHPSLELQLSAVRLASTFIAPLTREDSSVYLDSATSTRTRRIRRLVSHIKLRPAKEEPVHFHDKKIPKINSEYRRSQTQEEEALVQDSSRTRILRISNQPLVQQVTHAVSLVFRTPLRLPKNTVTVTCHAPESVERPISDVVTFTYPPYPVSKMADSSERKWPWQTRELCIEA
ncbi:uncharacterized protein BJ212DRAFT_1321921 [Suillus subaureus]|uniref:Uncharacterized protein n=1 Tax=Suillus subaureus TaxID=48587 RepID=A0A9P7EL72_9AGAM|nr:uncharacterized protein BJ212DRAFT_1321921 [Suillus subaureus]KAG1824689.1 hypothetical protein BJ212DRAFT_1321921 [Suillus subaureus]